ncbi:MAG: YigZ family protein [Bacteroidetes bacterium]|nr:YigZ family protein [Bacteroidota bacterium]
MVQDDTYRTVEQISRGIYREKGSKFLAIAIPVKSEFEVNEQLKSIRKEYHDASHWCFAYRLGYNKLIFRSNDDGEPSGTAGKPIFGQILSHDLTNILVVVVRYFSGTKLGVSGLITAYKTAVKEALKEDAIVQKTVNDVFKVEFEYENMNDVMKIMKGNNIIQQSQNFDIGCSITFAVQKSKSEKVVLALKNIRNLTLIFLETI